MSSSPETHRYSIGAATFEAPRLPAGLYITATPIGNLADITLRALETLASADMVLCEDTRVTAKLLNRYAIRTRLSPYHDHNAAKVRPRIVMDIMDGASVALVTDAGMPLVSDPGFKLGRAIIEAGLPVTVIPGASAPLAALALSGLPTDRFMFSGFLPSKRAARLKMLAGLKDIDATLILFESASRIIETLHDIGEVLGARSVAVTRELTKLYEEVLRGNPKDLARILSERDAIKGEITLVIGPPEIRAIDPESVDIALREAAAELPAGQAAAEVARRFGLSKRDTYARLLALRQAG